MSGALIGAAAPAHADQWRDRQWHLGFLKAEQVHEITRGEGVTVAVVDTGVDRNHPDLKGNVLKGTDTVESGPGWRDTDGHGTGMAAAIAGHGHGPEGRDGVLGLAPEAKILPVRTATGLPKKKGNRGHAIPGLEWASDSDAKVINFSGTMSGVLTEVERALAHDIVFVAGAGNSAQHVGVQQPASYPGVIAVSGVDRDGNFTDESVEGPEVVLAAPAVDIAGAGAGKRGKYVTATGTSDAAALVSATAALIRAKYPDLSANGVINRLIKTADDKGPPGRDDKYGFGVVNPLKALTADIPDIDHNPLIAPSAVPSSSASSDSAAPGGQASAGDDANDNVPLALTIVGIILALVAGGIYLMVRRIRRSAPATAPHQRNYHGPATGPPSQSPGRGGP